MFLNSTTRYATNYALTIGPCGLRLCLHDTHLTGVISTCAALTFVCRPTAQLKAILSAAELILKCNGGALISTNLIATIFLFRPCDATSRLVAFWHLWPTHRAIVRIQHGIDVEGEIGKTLGGPPVHLLVHSVLFVMFMFAGLVGPLQDGNAT